MPKEQGTALLLEGDTLISCGLARRPQVLNNDPPLNAYAETGLASFRVTSTLGIILLELSPDPPHLSAGPAAPAPPGGLRGLSGTTILVTILPMKKAGA